MRSGSDNASDLSLLFRDQKQRKLQGQERIQEAKKGIKYALRKRRKRKRGPVQVILIGSMIRI